MLAKWGVYDFAGGIVVHTTAGFSALASLLVVGRREVPDTARKQLETPHNIPMVMLGTALLWFGWFGFNGGSALGSGGLAVAAGVNSEIAGSVACFVWMLIDWCKNKKPGLVGICVGAIAGLATVTPAAGYVQPWAAAVIGLIASVMCYCCCELQKALDLDDALDVWGVHGMGGFIGTVLVGVLADPDECGETPAPSYCVNPGTVTRSGAQVCKQLLAVSVCAAYSFAVTLVILKVMSLFCRIVPTEKECRNLDAALHGEQAYPASNGAAAKQIGYSPSDSSTDASSSPASSVASSPRYSPASVVIASSSPIISPARTLTPMNLPLPL